MKRLVLLAAMAAVWTGALGLAFPPAAEAKSPQPLVVLSLSSYDDVAGEIESIAKLAEAPEMPTWLSGMLKLYGEGKEAGGLDKSRPWGAVIQLGDGLSAYGFFPVTDPETLSWELGDYIRDVEDVGDGIYKVIGEEEGKQLYALPSNGWLFIADCPDVLATVPSDPAKLLRGLNTQYDAALRFELKNVPADHGKKLLAFLDKKLGAALRKGASEQTMEIIGGAAYALDQVTLGWSEHRAE